MPPHVVATAVPYERIRARRALPGDHDLLARAGVRSPLQRITPGQQAAEARLFQELVTRELETLRAEGGAVDRDEAACRVAERRPDLADSSFAERFERRRRPISKPAPRLKHTPTLCGTEAVRAAR